MNESSRTDLPEWYPAWAERLGDAYLSQTSCVFLLHGNVRDLVPLGGDSSEGEAWGTLSDFLCGEIFGSWEVVLGYDVGRGLRPLAGADGERHRSMNDWLTSRLGGPAGWPREPDAAMAVIDGLLERNLLDPADRRSRIAVVLDYAQYLVGDDEGRSSRAAGRLVRLLSWAGNPLLRRVNVAVVLVADSLAEVHPRLVRSPSVGVIELPLPDGELRRCYARDVAGSLGITGENLAAAERAAAGGGGLSLESLRGVLTLSAREGQPADGEEFSRHKKELIERSCRGLVEFIEPGLTLDAVAGHTAAKERLAADARSLRSGELAVAPMGYLICGPVGTGKSFTAECYAGSVGIPCAVLKNFRSKYVGETEANLEHALGVLRELGPVVVVIDEADAALGNRESGGDSGTSARVFSMIARQMGDSRYRGKIVWMLLTSRPDLLPIDLKRQGRAEVHIPLFYPEGPEELTAMFRALAAKNRLRLAGDPPLDLIPPDGLSGADIESILLAARRVGLERAAAEGRPPADEISQADLAGALAGFLPSTEGLEKEMQEIAAVLECTDRGFLPERWLRRVDHPGGRTAIQERLAELRSLLG